VTQPVDPFSILPMLPDSFILPPVSDKLDRSAPRNATLQQTQLCVEHAGE